MAFDEAELLDDPVATFKVWFDHAGQAGEPEPEAMALATAGSDGFPSVRIVLLRGLDERGFVFYTNRRSRKGQEIAANPAAALAFRWVVVDRQVRVRGSVTQVADEESDRYFSSRPRGSQLGAWASEQSRPIPSRADLEARLEEITVRYEGGDVPRPPWWGGYRIEPTEVEFWQQGDSRLHDRFLYRLEAGGWTRHRLNP